MEVELDVKLEVELDELDVHHRMSAKGCTELKICVAEAKYCEESVSHFRLAAAPQKAIKHMDKTTFLSLLVQSQSMWTWRLWEGIW